MILVGALQPGPISIDDRFSQRAIEVTVERATPPPAPRAEIAEIDSNSIRPGPPTDSAPSDAAQPKLEDSVAATQPPPAVSGRELALAATAAAIPRPSPQQKAIKPSTSATPSPASQRQALQDYVLQVVAKLSHSRFYAASQAAQNGDGVVVARLTVARDGGLVDLSLPKQSGSAGVDSSVLDAIRKAAPFAPLPKSFADNRFTFIVPINYAPER
jgi:protein TonB